MYAYLDHASSTPICEDAKKAITQSMEESFGNPTGAHRTAQKSRRQLDDARETLAEVCGARPSEVIFCGSGTEADNLAIFGAGGIDLAGSEVVCSAVEHHAVLRPVEHLGGKVIGTDNYGQILENELMDALNKDTRLVSVMLVNNETGIISNLRAVSGIVREHAPQALLHTDAAQAMFWLDISEYWTLVDMVSLSAHKFGGPKGIGSLLVKEGTSITPQILGGKQEKDHRSGTQNVMGAAGMAAAALWTSQERAGIKERVGQLRDKLADGLMAQIKGLHRTPIAFFDAVSAENIPKTENSIQTEGMLHICLEDIEAEALLVLLTQAGVEASAASSCSSGAQDSSHVLKTMGYPAELAAGSLRLSLGAFSTDSEIEHALKVIPEAVAALRAEKGSQ